MKIIGIYLITSPTGRRYIGSSKDVEKRFSYYRRLACKLQRKLYRSLNKYGVENHTFEVIYQCSFDDLYKWERFFGDQFNCVEEGLNLSLPGYKESPAIVSQETKDKLSKKLKGRTLTEETKRKISESKKDKTNRNKGRKLSEDHKNKITRKDKKHSEETKKRMSESAKKRWMKND
jgi:group I intron endonuclease